MSRRQPLPPRNYYALWKFAEHFGNPGNFTLPDIAELGRLRCDGHVPYGLNTRIAGLIGLDRLARLRGAVGEAEVLERSLVPLIVLRIALSKQPASLRQSGLEYGSFRWTVDQYRDDMAPYRFVSPAEEFGNEGLLQPLQDTVGLLSAKEMILARPRDELEKYLDLPAFATGDLFFIQTLCAVLEAK